MSSKALRRVLIGLESSPGQVATPDVALRANASLTVVPDKVVVEENIGSFAPARHYLASYKAEGELEFTAYYEHAPFPVAMALGSYTPVDLGGGLYEYHFALPDGTANSFATFTMEYGDGADHVIQATDVFATALEIAGEAGQAWEITPELVGAGVLLKDSLSANPTPPQPTTVRMADTVLYMDDAYGNIGSTEVEALISFSWKLENYQHSKLFAGSLVPTSRGNDRWKVTLELVLEVEEDNVEAEINKILTTNQSAIRIKATSGSETMTIDGNYFLNEVETLDDRDGNNTIKLVYMGQKDSSNNTGEIEIVTDLESL